MSRSFISWLLVTVGLALFSVSVVLVPNNAFADDGSECIGTCTYQSDEFGMWTLTSSTCTADGCSCPNPPNLPPGQSGEQVQTDCNGNAILCDVINCTCRAGPPCAPVDWWGCNWCLCVDYGIGWTCI